MVRLFFADLVAVVPHEQLFQRWRRACQRADSESDQVPQHRVEVCSVDLERGTSAVKPCIVDAGQRFEPTDWTLGFDGDSCAGEVP